MMIMVREGKGVLGEQYEGFHTPDSAPSLRLPPPLPPFLFLNLDFPNPNVCTHLACRPTFAFLASSHVFLVLDLPIYLASL